MIRYYNVYTIISRVVDQYQYTVRTNLLKTRGLQNNTFIWRERLVEFDINYVILNTIIKSSKSSGYIF